MYDNPHVTTWGHDYYCILTDDGYFLRSNGEFYGKTFDDSRWNTKEEAEQFLKGWIMGTENYLMIDGKRTELSEETVKKLKKELSKERYYMGERFTGGFDGSHEYVLTRLRDNQWALVDIEKGCTKNGIYELDSKFDDTGRRYVTKLPTLYPNETHRKV